VLRRGTLGGGGGVTCETNEVDPVFKFDRNTGKVLATFGKGVMITHGIHVERQGNVWIAHFAATKERTKGHQVHRFSLKGEKLDLGTPEHAAGLVTEPEGASASTSTRRDRDVSVPSLNHYTVIVWGGRRRRSHIATPQAGATRQSVLLFETSRLASRHGQPIDGAAVERLGARETIARRGCARTNCRRESSTYELPRGVSERRPSVNA
jgi:hypothetical protein